MNSTQKKYMLKNINSIKVCKFIDIGAIMYDLLLWMKQYLKKNVFQVFVLYIFNQIAKSCQLPHAKMWPLMPDFWFIWLSLQKGFISILSKTLFRYQCNIISLQLFSLIFDHFMPNNTPPLQPITVFIYQSPFKIQILPHIFFPQ